MHIELGQSHSLGPINRISIGGVFAQSVQKLRRERNGLQRWGAAAEREAFTYQVSLPLGDLLSAYRLPWLVALMDADFSLA